MPQLHRPALVARAAPLAAALARRGGALPAQLWFRAPAAASNSKRWRGGRGTATVAATARSEMMRPKDAGDLFGGRPASLCAVSPTESGRFYQRSLPAAQVSFSSVDGRRLFREAFAAGHMENYFYLAEQFRTQDEPTFCGLSTLAMVLNSLRIDPMRTWKGSWRWFNEQNLNCCTGPSKVREEGLSFDMFKCLAGCNGAEVTAHRAPTDSEGSKAAEAFADAFRAAVRATSCSCERESIVVCYSREALHQSGAGHFSPIGGYHADNDMVLILDVARFKYPPHWARLRDVVDGMLRVDPATGRPRGYLQLRPHPAEPEEGHQLKPLHVTFMSPAAGRGLSSALGAALAPPPRGNGGSRQGAAPLGAAPAVAAMRRWLHAASVAEPQVLCLLLQVGDAPAVQDMLEHLHRCQAYQRLCSAYADLVAGAGLCCDLRRDFPRLRFTGPEGRLQEGEALSLDTCGELWVLLLLLLPEHLRAAVSEELAGPEIARALTDAVRGPWALPLEALREVLGHLLPRPEAGRCLQERPRWPAGAA